MSRTLVLGEPSTQVKWAAFIGTCNPNSGSREDKEKLIKNFQILLTQQKFAIIISKKFRSSISALEAGLVLLEDLTNVSVERENGLHTHVYFVWCWQKKEGAYSYQVDIDRVKRALSRVVGEVAVKEAHIHFDYVKVNPQLYAYEFDRKYPPYFQKYFRRAPQHTQLPELPTNESNNASQQVQQMFGLE